ncbi:MAG: synthase subunit b [Acidobacteria bacterium]|nr:synthase subunit b [Acidobacteriota bacterium]
MIRKALLILVLTFIPFVLFAQQGEIAHGAEKDAHKIAHPNEEHGEGHEGPKTYFGIPAWILKLANMIAFIAVLGYLIGGPMKKSFAERRAAITRAAEEAKSRREKADRLAADIQARLGQIESEVQAIHERAVAEGERQKRELLAAAEAEAQKILAAARIEVANRVKHARHELTEYAGELAAQRAEAILREKITLADQQKLFYDSVQEVAEVQS